jgi:hypothetical protein
VLQNEKKRIPVWSILLGGVGILLILAGVSARRDGGFTIFWGVVALLWAAFKFKSATRPKDHSRGLPEDARQAMLPLAYKHFAGRSGIAIDPAQRLVHLVADGKYKRYGFTDIRNWSTNLHTGGMHMTGGFAGAAANLATQRQNAESSGLFLEVKDIDYPLWKIRFAEKTAKDYEMQLARWSEILRQHLA